MYSKELKCQNQIASGNLCELDMRVCVGCTACKVYKSIDPLEEVMGP